MIAVITLMGAFAANAQKYAVVDMSYILKNVPMYESANEQIKQLSDKWQKEVESKNDEAKVLYKNYQTEKVFYSNDMQAKRKTRLWLRRKRPTTSNVNTSALKATCSRSARA